jgi:8-oxo-dGTP pyrophosphatase MutT (NUDIX family)
MAPADLGEPVSRSAVRVVVVDADRCVLLIRTENFTSVGDEVWGLPGGKIEEDESPEAAAARELAEETGLDVRVPGPPVAIYDSEFVFQGRLYRQRDHIFAVAVTESKPAVLLPREPRFRGFSWWEADRLATARIRVFPPQLPAAVQGWATAVTT